MTVDQTPTAATSSSVLTSRSDPSSYWSTTNVGEAMPGVPTPLGWSVWGPAAELGVRRPFVSLGALEPEHGVLPTREEDRVVSIFSGRVAARVDFLAQMGDRMPGTSGPALVEQFLGVVPDDMTFSPSKRRYPVIAVKLPLGALRVRKRVYAEQARVTRWWAEEVGRTPTLDLVGARAQFTEANATFCAAVVLQADGMFMAGQPAYDQVLRLIERAGVQHLSSDLMGGGGDHAETEMVLDLWKLGRDRITLEEFLGLHGYHGPLEGEISGRVWREDSSPVTALAAKYAQRDEGLDPSQAGAQRDRKRIAAEQELLGRLPRWQRSTARLVLSLGRQNSSLRGVGKTTFLRALDVARAAARRCGEILVSDGVLADPDDVFYLTADELSHRVPHDVAAVVAARRAERAEYQGYDVPSSWKGNPTPVPIDGRSTAEEDTVDTIQGMGVSGGVVEGIARVVTDPAFADVEPDEILVAPTTDPSWASIMFLSEALVVDIGGHLSHAAIVARELGIPCVVDTQRGSRVIKDGDRIRVDGATGLVEVLKRAANR
jgi:pyruvate,water dikinase